MLFWGPGHGASPPSKQVLRVREGGSPEENQLLLPGVQMLKNLKQQKSLVTCSHQRQHTFPGISLGQRAGSESLPCEMVAVTH